MGYPVLLVGVLLVFAFFLGFLLGEYLGRTLTEKDALNHMKKLTANFKVQLEEKNSLSGGK